MVFKTFGIVFQEHPTSATPRVISCHILAEITSSHVYRCGPTTQETAAIPGGGHVPRERAIDQGRAACTVVVHPAAVFTSRVVRERAAVQGRVAVFVVHPAAFLSRVAHESAVGQIRNQHKYILVADTATVVRRIALEHAAAQGRA